MSHRGLEASWVGKLGGSLLEPPDFPGLPGRLETLIRERGGSNPLLVVGGGPTVDLIRRWDRLFELGETFSHWTAVASLAINARIVERILPASVFVESAGDLAGAWKEGRLPILSCEYFLREIDEARSDPLPRRWRVTSDSIAARVAEHHGARELALIKSTSPPALLSLGEAAGIGYVDPVFPRCARNLPLVVAINLRASPPEIREIGGRSGARAADARPRGLDRGGRQR